MHFRYFDAPEMKVTEIVKRISETKVKLITDEDFSMDQLSLLVNGDETESQLKQVGWRLISANII